MTLVASLFLCSEMVHGKRDCIDGYHSNEPKLKKPARFVLAPFKSIFN